jgi:hypothetical protein
MRQSAFADVLAGCGSANLNMGDASTNATGKTFCFVRNDSPIAFEGSVAVEFVEFAGAASIALATIPVRVPAGGGAMQFFCPTGKKAVDDGSTLSCPTFEELFAATPACAQGGSACIMHVTVTASATAAEAAAAATTARTLSDATLPLAVPGTFVLPQATITATLSGGAISIDGDASGVAVAISVESKSSGLALYVWLSTLAQGRFSDNGFMMKPGKITITFLPFGPLDAALLASSLRVEHLGQHLP